MAAPDSTTVAAVPADGPPDCTSRMSFWPLFGGIAGRPVLLVAAGVVLLGAWGLLGRYFGVSDLFWHQDGLTQILAGLGAALLLGQVCFVSYLLDGDHP